MQGPSSAVGTITHDGVEMSSNYQTADEMKASLGIEAPADETAAPEIESEAPPANAVAEPPTSPTTDTPAQTAKPVEKVKPAQPRIDKLTFEREEAKREAARERAAREASDRKFDELRAEWRREFETLKQTAKPQEKPAQADLNADPEPDFTNTEAYPDGQFDRKYLKDQARWEARQEFKEQNRVAREAFQAEQRERQQYERQQQEHQRIATFATKVEGVLSERPELRTQLESVSLTRPIWDAVMEGKSPADVLAHLHSLSLRLAENNPDPKNYPNLTELDLLLRKPPLQAYGEVIRLNYELDQAAAVTGSAPAKPKTSAHPPVSPVSGSHSAPASGPPDPNTCTQEEFDAYWNAQEKAQRSAGRR